MTLLNLIVNILPVYGRYILICVMSTFIARTSSGMVNIGLADDRESLEQSCSAYEVRKMINVKASIKMDSAFSVATLLESLLLLLLLFYGYLCYLLDPLFH